ncbi:glutamine amidotransferase [Chitinivorax tropicus]|uniref:Imidazole glycerol phosphate synthase subunit HisH n=1 Tax=Chitinivorax tropicus TaxID=714531 RepID=A0A840MPQ7_9PROT|nr:imidazole glycerol phosphate synthase subunit HisH [Chitinivorax tropicus]MBB5019079.1 glutamine amidotransferase [Chitinivorax tropicus]
MKQTIAVIDYGMGNLRSVTKALEHVAPDSRVLLTSDARQIEQADKVVFPGQGAMRDCMAELTTRGLRDAVHTTATDRPFLGICIGEQMLFEHSEEFDTPGLGILPGQVKRFPSDQMVDAQGQRLKVPHMGWSEVWHSRPHPLWHGIEDGARFYFVHSYFVTTPDTALTTGESTYPNRFTCAVGRNNLFATQFHPEKSHSAGLRLLSNFVAWNGQA